MPLRRHEDDIPVTVKNSDEVTKVVIAFYIMDGWDRNERFITNLTALATGRCIHLDIKFDDGNATSIRMGETVSYHQMSFSNPKKHLMEFVIQKRDAETMKHFAQRAHKAAIPFNSKGFYRCWLPRMFTRKTTDDAYFCSEYICRMFQQIGFFTDIEAGACTPNMIMQMIAHRGVPIEKPVPKKRSKNPHQHSYEMTHMQTPYDTNSTGKVKAFKMGSPPSKQQGAHRSNNQAQQFEFRWRPDLMFGENNHPNDGKGQYQQLPSWLQ